MAYQAGGQRPGGSPKAQATGLMLIRVAAGVFLFFTGLNKIRWLLDSTALAHQLSLWLSQATPLSRWYLERILPGAPVFARVVPLAEMIAGLALVVGFWTRLAAAVTFLMVLNFQFAGGAMFTYAYLTDAKGLPLLGILLGLALGGANLPLSVRK
jgi:uncharacterized membrane protein YphA (DoxX/SURF4 family)